jgi:hypothetical protein
VKKKKQPKYLQIEYKKITGVWASEKQYHAVGDSFLAVTLYVPPKIEQFIQWLFYGRGWIALTDE